MRAGSSAAWSSCHRRTIHPRIHPTTGTCRRRSRSARSSGTDPCSRRAKTIAAGPSRPAAAPRSRDWARADRRLRPWPARRRRASVGAAGSAVEGVVAAGYGELPGVVVAAATCGFSRGNRSSSCSSWCAPRRPSRAPALTPRPITIFFCFSRLRFGRVGDGFPCHFFSFGLLGRGRGRRADGRLAGRSCCSVDGKGRPPLAARCRRRGARPHRT